MDKLYGEFLENIMVKASEGTRRAYREMEAAKENYICEVQEDMFKQAFLFGYEMGVRTKEQREIEKIKMAM